MNDIGHRPHASFKGQLPSTRIAHGPEDLEVTLDAWGPKDALPTVLSQINSNWGNEPMALKPAGSFTPNDHRMLESAFMGDALQNALEMFTFSFTINNVTRACTHQLVRTRVGASFMQHGGRDNDWRHRGWTMPETIRRATGEPCEGELVRWDNPKNGCKAPTEGMHLAWRERIRAVLNASKTLYAEMVDAGIPWQDARRLLPMGTQTYIHANYNYPALRGFLANRLEYIMDWEINCVAQLMRREVVRLCPAIFSVGLQSHSDRQRRAAFAQLTSWPPDGKWPVSEEVREVPRTHTATQMPFFVLHPDCYLKDPIIWIRTNGEYPQGEGL